MTDDQSYELYNERTYNLYHDLVECAETFSQAYETWSFASGSGDLTALQLKVLASMILQRWVNTPAKEGAPLCSSITNEAVVILSAWVHKPPMAEREALC